MNDPKNLSKSLGDMAREELRRNVSVMRELGVMSWNGIVLGPPPATAQEVSEAQDQKEVKLSRADRAKLRHYADLLNVEQLDPEALKYLP
jgi:hypothetical protein